MALAANPVTGQTQYFMDQWSILNGGSNSGFNLAWELDFWGRFRRAVESAEATLEASVEGYDDAMVTLLADVATNYVTIRTSQERIKVAETAAKRQGELLRMVEARFKAGTATKVDVDHSRRRCFRSKPRSRSSRSPSAKRPTTCVLYWARRPTTCCNRSATGPFPPLRPKWPWAYLPTSCSAARTSARQSGTPPRSPR